jgi:hypothetical protein
MFWITCSLDCENAPVTLPPCPFCGQKRAGCAYHCLGLNNDAPKIAVISKEKQTRI